MLRHAARCAPSTQAANAAGVAAAAAVPALAGNWRAARAVAQRPLYSARTAAGAQRRLHCHHCTRRAFSSSSTSSNHSSSHSSDAATASAAATAAAAARDAIPDAEFSAVDSDASAPDQTAQKAEQQQRQQSATPTSSTEASVVEAIVVSSTAVGSEASTLFSAPRIRRADSSTSKNGDGGGASDGRPVLAAWGAGFLGCLGRQSYADAALPVPVELGSAVPASIASSWGRNVVVSSRGSVFEWGWRKSFRLLLKVAAWQRDSPFLVRQLQRLKLGMLTLCGADPLGPARHVGWGHEVGEDRLGPEEERLRLYAVSAAAGSDFSAVLSSQGQVYTWGNNFYGQTGHTAHLSQAQLPAPTLVAHYQNQHPNESLGRHIETGLVTLPPSFPSTPLVAVAAGFAHLLLLTRAGQVYACGKSDTGALGITHIYRDSKRLFLPHLVPITDAFWSGEQGSGEAAMREAALDSGEACLTEEMQAQNDTDIVDTYTGPIVAVAAGMKYSLMLSARGQVYAAGGSGLNELGNGRFYKMAGWVPVHLPLRFREPERSPRWRANRRAGLNGEEAVDDADANDDNFFAHATRAEAPTEKIVSIAAGAHHALALSNLGFVYSWGLNQQGQTGVPPREEDQPVGKGFLSKWTSKLSRKRRPPTQAEALAAMREAQGATDPNADSNHGSGSASNVAPYVRASPSNLARINTARLGQVGSMCVAPSRVRVEHLLSGLAEGVRVSPREFGQVVSISAGFYDSVLVSDRGYALTFGGALSQDRAHGPHLMRIDAPSAAPVSAADRARGHPWPTDTATSLAHEENQQGVAGGHTRIKKVAFGLTHAIAIVQTERTAQQTPSSNQRTPQADVVA
jgi:alpha-tubulin suppressor-like RCC1 family protein